jgi:hypothetical protein
MDIRENNIDVMTMLKNFDGLISVFRVDDLETAGLDHISCIHADKEFILDNQDHRLLGIRQ